MRPVFLTYTTARFRPVRWQQEKHYGYSQKLRRQLDIFRIQQTKQSSAFSKSAYYSVYIGQQEFEFFSFFSGKSIQH